MMEGKVFRRPAVAGVLEGFVEARLHNDTGPSIRETVEREKELVGSIGTPAYVIIDPGTGKRLNVQEGASTAATFLEFLRKRALE